MGIDDLEDNTFVEVVLPSSVLRDLTDEEVYGYRRPYKNGGSPNYESKAESTHMPAQLNHTIVWCRDKTRSAEFLAAILGRPPPKPFFHFMVVGLDNSVSLDFMERAGEVAPQHYAFLVGEDDFDAVFARIHAANFPYWADPERSQPNEINHHDGGRGVYFEDPNGHLLEVITQPYGSGPVLDPADPRASEPTRGSESG